MKWTTTKITHWIKMDLMSLLVNNTYIIHAELSFVLINSKFFYKNNERFTPTEYSLFVTYCTLLNHKLFRIDQYYFETHAMFLLIFFLLFSPIFSYSTYIFCDAGKTEFKCFFCINCLLLKWHPSLHFVTITFDNPVSHSIIIFIWWIYCIDFYS